MRRSGIWNAAASTLAITAFCCITALAQPSANEWQPACKQLPSHNALQAALVAAVNVQGGNGGFGLNMWGTVVNRDGVVCAVVFSGSNRGDQWPGSRVISAQKANTANAFSLPKLALSTADLLLSRTAGQKPLRPAAQQSGRYIRGLWWRLD
ncbi:MAG: hypothetical protein WAK33_14895 [Silvibacterium sp.]